MGEPNTNSAEALRGSTDAIKEGGFGRAADIKDLSVVEHYLPVRLMDTVVVLITLDDNDLFWDGPAESGSFDDDDDDYTSWTRERHDSGD
jgi:hypothetical protein